MTGLDRDADGRIAHASALAAARTSASPELVFAAVEATRTAMVVSDPRLPDNPIIFANRAFRELSGYDETELIGRNCRFLQGPGTDPADVARIREAVAARREVTCDLLNYRRDGTGFVNELHISPIFDESGELRYFFGSQTDLAQYRKDTRRLQTSEERYRSLFDALDTGFCTIEMLYDEAGRPIDYRYIELNPAFRGQTGLSDAVGRRIRELAPEHEQHWFELYGRVDLERRAERFEDEALGRIYDVQAYPVGQPAEHKVAVLFADVTAQRRAERDLRALAETLESQVHERTRDLESAGEALRQSQKMEAFGQLTGGVAHDFNNLLTIIRSAAEFLRRPATSEDRRRRYVEAISETADRAASLTGQLLAFARRQPLKPEVFDACLRIDSVAELARSLVGPQVTVEVEHQAEDPCLTVADANQLDTALLNLASNARDAMQARGRLRFVTHRSDGLPAIRDHPSRPGRFIAVNVVDTGPGIDAQTASRIFEPFFTTKAVGQGTGLGLSQVFGFAKQSGGDLDVRSSSDGAAFILYLPAAEPGEAALAPAADRGRSDLPAGTCVLVVEDNAEVGRFSTELLHDLGVKTAWVGDAASALDQLHASPDGFDLVFSDVIMPGMSGVELAREVKRLFPALPVVLTSGYSSALADGAAAEFSLLKKPYSVESLTRVLADALAERPDVRPLLS